jgi:hypothetical protein
MPVRHVCEGIVLVTASTPIGRCSTSIKRYASYLFVVASCSPSLPRVVPFHSVLTVELSASLGPPMSVATVAARRHTLKGLVLKKAIHRVSFSRDL